MKRAWVIGGLGFLGFFAVVFGPWMFSDTPPRAGVVVGKRSWVAATRLLFEDKADPKRPTGEVHLPARHEVRIADPAGGSWWVEVTEDEYEAAKEGELWDGGDVSRPAKKIRGEP
jgi:hypothetical protein